MQRPAHLDYATARRLLAGDAREFRALFDSYFPRLYRFALARQRAQWRWAGCWRIMSWKSRIASAQ